jgi:hypothetical protein
VVLLNEVSSTPASRCGQGSERKRLLEELGQGTYSKKATRAYKQSNSASDLLTFSIESSWGKLRGHCGVPEDWGRTLLTSMKLVARVLYTSEDGE